jgi:hypothetical protein
VAQKPCSTISAGASSHAGSKPNRALVRRQEERLLGAEVEEHGPLRDADVMGDVLDPCGAEPVLGEVLHRDVDDAGRAAAPRRPRVWYGPDAPSPLMCGT